MSVDPERLVNKILKVAALPKVVLKFNEAIQNPVTTNHDLENIISEDTALASRLLRIANSAMYNFPSKIETIDKAITIIGHQQMNEIILGCSIIKLFQNIPQEIVNMEQFWEHSLAVATASRIIASYRREQNIEKHFTSGLLHDIGRLIILIELPKQTEEIINKARTEDLLLVDVEKGVLGFDHAKLGAMLLKKWKLPERLVSSVYYHHMPNISPGNIVDPAIVHIADIICHAVQYGSSGEMFVPRLQNKAWESLNISSDTLPSLMEQLEVQHKEAVKHILGND